MPTRLLSTLRLFRWLQSAKQKINVVRSMERNFETVHIGGGLSLLSDVSREN